MTPEAMEGIRQFAGEVHALAKEKGWWDAPRSPVECLALVHSEVSECVEDLRAPKPFWGADGMAFVEAGITYSELRDCPDARRQLAKPVGPAVELADAVIRILDLAESQGWDIAKALSMKDAYNANRPYRHGGKTL